MRISLLAWVILLLVADLAVGAPHVSSLHDNTVLPTPSASPTQGASIVLVEIEDFLFAPARTEINVGDTVRWKNLDSSPHSIISDEDDEPIDSGRLDKGAGFRYQFDTPGTYNYECGYHQNMGGVIIVRSVTGTSAGEATPTA